MSNGEPTRHAIIAGKKGILDQTVRQNHNRNLLIRGMIEDQETNSNQDQDLQETVITAENQDTNKLNAEQESIH